MGADDPSMGWSRYCESFRTALITPSLVHMLPTKPSVALAKRMAASATANKWTANGVWAADASEAVALSTELLVPAHDDTTLCVVRYTG